MESIIDRIKIDKYETGWVITIKDKNTTLIKEYPYGCFISYKERLFRLEHDYITEYKNENEYSYVDEEFKRILPLVLEYGDMSPVN